MEEYITLEKEFIKGFAVEHDDRFAERAKLAELARDMHRTNIDEKIKTIGIGRVFRVLAATVKANPTRYDARALYVARQVPPLAPGRRWEDWFLSDMHPIYVQENLLKIARLRAE